MVFEPKKVNRAVDRDVDLDCDKSQASKLKQENIKLK